MPANQRFRLHDHQGAPPIERRDENANLTRVAESTRFTSHRVPDTAPAGDVETESPLPTIRAAEARAAPLEQVPGQANDDGERAQHPAMMPQLRQLGSRLIRGELPLPNLPCRRSCFWTVRGVECPDQPGPRKPARRNRELLRRRECSARTFARSSKR